MLKDSLPEELLPDELILRAVRAIPNYWKDDRITSAALKDPNGLSVDRTYDRSLEESVAFMQQHLTGGVVSLTQDACNEVTAVVLYLPVEDNIFHCELHGSNEQKILSKRQAKELALRAKIEYRVAICST